MTSGPAGTSGPSEAASELEGKVFTATAIEGGAAIVAGSTIEVTFVDGRVVVNAGCNAITGPVSLADGTLVADELASTVMACDPPLMDQDTWLAEFLSSGPTWTLDAGTLTLDNGTATMKFEQT